MSVPASIHGGRRYAFALSVRVGTDARTSVQVRGRTRALQHPYLLHSMRALNKTVRGGPTATHPTEGRPCLGSVVRVPDRVDREPVTVRVATEPLSTPFMNS